jgi:RNA polymerase sigma-70 factor (ECF subfamily)
VDHSCQPYTATLAYSWLLCAEGREPFDDDEALVQRWQRGDMRTAQRLVERYTEALQRFLARRHAQAIDDLVQQTFAACFSRRGGFRRDSSFRTFLFAIAQRQLLAQRRARRRSSELRRQALILLGSTGIAPEVAIGGDWLEQALDHAIAALPEPLRRVIELSYWEQRSQEEIARELGITRRAVSERLRLARASLERALVRERTRRSKK